MYSTTIGIIALAALAVAVVGTTITVQHVFAPTAPPHGVRPPLAVLINFDDSGTPLTGANNYKIHFTQIPPPHWTLTSLDKNNTPYNSTAWLSSVKKNTDGSLDIYVQHQSPAKDKVSNWLPSPKDSFHLFLRTPVIWGQVPPALTVQRMADGHSPVHGPAQMFRMK
jgi:hypothetical protein